MSNVKSKNLNTSILASFSGQQSHLTIPKVYVHITGNLEKAMVLNQIIFWSDKSTVCGEGWFYKEYKDWEQEILIQERTLRRIFSSLAEMGFCETKVKRIQGLTKFHIRPCVDNIMQAITRFISGSDKMAVPDRTNCPDYGSDKMAVPIYTDQYTEKNLHNLSDGVKTPSPKAKKPYEKNARFMAFYDAYPKKEKPHDAYKAFLKLNPDDQLLAHIIADVKAKTEKHDQWKDRQYIPQPSRYLNSGDYESEIINHHEDRKKKEEANLKENKKAEEQRALASQRAADLERENNARKRSDGAVFRSLNNVSHMPTKPKKLSEMLKEQQNALATNGTKTIL